MTQEELNKVFMPFSLIRHKEDGALCIVAGNYALLCGSFNGGCNFEHTALYDIDDDGKVIRYHAWEDAGDFELVDDKHPREYYNRVLEYLSNMYNHPFDLGRR